MTCSSSAYPPSPIFFFFIISNLNLKSLNVCSSPLPVNTKRSGPVIITTPLQIQWAGASRIWCQFPFFTGFVFRNHRFYSLALLLKEKGVSCSHDLSSWGRAAPSSSPEGRVGMSNPCKSIGQTVSLRKSSFAFPCGLFHQN